MDTLKQRINHLAQTHHEPLLQAIQTALQKQNPFTWRKSDGRDLPWMPMALPAVLAAGSRWREAALLTPAPESTARASTLPVTPEEDQALRKIQCQLSKHFEEVALARGLFPNSLPANSQAICSTLPLLVRSQVRRLLS